METIIVMAYACVSVVVDYLDYQGSQGSEVLITRVCSWVTYGPWGTADSFGGSLNWKLHPRRGFPPRYVKVKGQVFRWLNIS